MCVCVCVCVWDFPGGSDGKSLSAVQETQIQSMLWEDALEKEMATHSSREFHGQEEPDRPQSIRLQRVTRDWRTNMHRDTHTHMYN